MLSLSVSATGGLVTGVLFPAEPAIKRRATYRCLRDEYGDRIPTIDNQRRASD